MLTKIKRRLTLVGQFHKNFFEDPSKRVCQVRIVLNNILYFVGADFLDNWKFNVLSAISAIASITFVIFTLYTAWHFLDQKDLLLQMVCCQGIFVPVFLYFEQSNSRNKRKLIKK